MNLTVIGRGGQLAHALAKYAPTTTRFYGREALDLSASPKALKAFVNRLPKTDALILTAAFTQVDQAESQSERAFNINTRAPAILAHSCQARSIPLIFISTDYVFNGRTRVPYAPTAPQKPVNFYGMTKALAERAITKSHVPGAIIRTSWVFDGVGQNFVTAMLGLKHKEHLSIVADQIGRPTYADHLAQGLLALCRNLPSGPAGQNIFHAQSGGAPVSWADFAAHIFDATNIPAPQIIPITTQSYGAPAPRPAYSVLNTASFEARSKYVMPDWTDGLHAALKDADI